MRIWPFKKKVRAHASTEVIRRVAREVLEGRTEPMLFGDLVAAINERLRDAPYSRVAVAIHTGDDFKSHGKSKGWTLKPPAEPLMLPPPSPMLALPAPDPEPAPVKSASGFVPRDTSDWRVRSILYVENVKAFTLGNHFHDWSGEAKVVMTKYDRKYFMLESGKTSMWLYPPGYPHYNQYECVKRVVSF